VKPLEQCVEVDGFGIEGQIGWSGVGHPRTSEKNGSAGTQGRPSTRAMKALSY
jgi:hypothetical protein